MTDKTHAVIEQPTKGEVSTINNAPPRDIIEAAIEKNMSADVIEKLLDQKIRYEADEARKDYAAAMSRCQKKMPAIQATAENSQTSSVYAKLEHINAGITPIYTAEGLSISFSEGEAAIPEMIRIQARVMHRSGHSEMFFYDLPLDLAGIKGNTNKTPVHAKASTTSYGRRYLLTMIFNLTVGDDVDGNLPAADIVSEEQALAIEAYVSENKMSAVNLMREFRVKAWSEVKLKDLDKVRSRMSKIAYAAKGASQ